MTTERIILTIAAMAAVLALGVAGCGDDEPAESPQEKQTTNDAEDWKPNPALRARSSSQIDPADIKQDDAPAPPFEFSTAKTAAALYAVRFEANREAVGHCGAKEFTVPGTIWFDEQQAPGGEPQMTFRGRVDGSYEFFYTKAVPCTFTDGDGKPLTVLQAKDTLDGEGTDENPFVTVFKIHLVRP